MAENSRPSRLTVERAAPEHESDILDEAEVKHAVGFVQYHHLNRVQVVHMLLQVVDQPAGVPIRISHLFQSAPLLIVTGSSSNTSPSLSPV